MTTIYTDYTMWIAFALGGIWLTYVAFLPERRKETVGELRQDSYVGVLPQYRPVVMPHDYEKRGHDSGLVLANSGYPALDVQIPPIPVGGTGYKLVFTETIPQLLERDHIKFLPASLEHPRKPGRDGGYLFEAMREGDVEKIEFAIVYKDNSAVPVWIKSKCSISRNPNSWNHPLLVSYLGQEPASAPQFN